MRGLGKENTPPFLLLMSFHGTVHFVEKESLLTVTFMLIEALRSALELGSMR